jgi:tRNA1Val (adenine37-N6)-methyltransferase
MSNSYFQFRQFRIEQGDTAMKVSTDACIQGAWTPILSGTTNVLDIGAGTGLLSLMIAQRAPVVLIDAIEMDQAAANQASANIAASPWNDQINLIHGDARIHSFGKNYDLIICNPPFFNNSLLGPDHQRNLARHTASLSNGDLFDTIKTHLSPTGYASIMLPPGEHQFWQSLLEKNGWGICRLLQVKPKSTAAVNRIISLCSPCATSETITEDLTIYRSKRGYSDKFTELMKGYYLNL